MKYALFSCLYPIVGCYMYASAVLQATSHFYILFPIPVVLVVVGLGLNYTWHHRTRERIDQLVRGNLILMIVWASATVVVDLYQRGCFR